MWENLGGADLRARRHGLRSSELVAVVDSIAHLLGSRDTDGKTGIMCSGMQIVFRGMYRCQD